MPDTTLTNLLERHAAFLSFLERRIGDRALAEDILQNAYVRAMERSGSLREQGSAVAWFYSILRNAVIDHFRSRTSENKALENWAAELEESSEEKANTTGDLFTRGLVCHCIEKVLPTLKPQYAVILKRVDLDEQPLGEFAREHGLSAGNAAVRAHRARAALKRELARVCGVCSLHSCLDCTCKNTAHAEPARATP